MLTLPTLAKNVTYDSCLARDPYRLVFSPGDTSPNSQFWVRLQNVPTKWGDTIDATRAQMLHALEDPLNQRFVTLSDTDVPLYPARMTYLQLMAETKARLSACKAWDLVNINRYTCRWAAHFLPDTIVCDSSIRSSRKCNKHSRQHAVC